MFFGKWQNDLLLKRKIELVSFLSTLLIESAQKWHQSCSSFVAVMFIRCHWERSAKQWEAISWKNVPGRAERCGQDAASRLDSRRLIELGTVAEKWKANRISDVIPLSTPRGALLLTLRLRLLLRPEMRGPAAGLWSEDTNFLPWRTQHRCAPTVLSPVRLCIAAPTCPNL